jgi:hypothetical protein
MIVTFVPLLAPANQMNYDTLQFYNGALAIVTGVAAAAVAFRLLPPMSPPLRTRRLLALTLRDQHRLMTGPIPRTANEWETRIYGRLSALPEQAEPLQRADAGCSLGRDRDHSCCVRFPCVHAVATTPAQRLGVLLRSFTPAVSAFPERVVGSACASSFSRFARRSLALRPAHSRCHQFVTR